MSNAENPLALIENVNGFDLYFTNKRIVGLKIAKGKSRYIPSIIGYVLGGAIGAGVVGALAANLQSGKDVQIIQAFNVDFLNETVKNKGCFSLAYTDVEMFVVSKSTLGGQLCLKGKNVWKYLQLNKAQFKLLASITPGIPVLADKLEVNS